jgi:DNA ligase D-like protein (predicted 3'-phosphoesterase)
VVHQHHASSLHYDLRLEVDGKLYSWAVPKGPSTEPGVRRLAVLTHDHSLSCLTVEGCIRPGAYGAGSILLWDRGVYEPTGQDAFDHESLIKAAMKRGILRFQLYGEKLRGGWTLTYWKENKWLWEKLDDAFASSRDILHLNRSVLTGRSLEDIAAGRTRPAPVRHILRMEVDGFYAAHWPQEGPLVVVRDGEVLDANELARKHGVRTGVTLRDASNLIPNVKVRHWQADDYRERNEKWLRVCPEFSDVIEPDDQHAAYLDLSKHPSPCDIADRAVAAVAYASECPIRFGVGPSKWVAKLATEVGEWSQAVKDPEGFLAPLPILQLKPVSPEARQRMHFLGYRTIGDVARLDPGVLRDQFGVEALLIQQAATGVHVDAVREVYPPNTASDRILFPEPIESLEALELNFRRLSDRVGGLLSVRGLEGSHLEFGREEEAGWRTRTREFARPMRDGRTVFVGLQLVSGSNALKEPLTGIRIRLKNLKRVRAYQPAFATIARTGSDDRAIQLNRALAQLQTTFGETSVRKASEVPIERRVRVLREWGTALGWR